MKHSTRSHTNTSSVLDAHYGFFTSLFNAIGDVLFPLRCIGCGVFDTLACTRCIAAHLRPQRAAGLSTDLHGAHHAAREDVIQSVVTLGPYADPFWRSIVATLKFQFQPTVLEHIGPVLGRAVRESLSAFDAVVCVPVPLHPRRERERGYNQSMLISTALGQYFDVPVAHKLLRRQIYTESQTLQGIDSHTAVHEHTPESQTVQGVDALAQVHARAVARQQNVAGTMSLGTVPDGVDWSAIHILLVDDVVTTGATIREAVRVLNTLGVQRVDVVALARGSGYDGAVTASYAPRKYASSLE